MTHLVVVVMLINYYNNILDFIGLIYEDILNSVAEFVLDCSCFKISTDQDKWLLQK